VQDYMQAIGQMVFREFNFTSLAIAYRNRGKQKPKG